jgi:hypothetical protein
MPVVSDLPSRSEQYEPPSITKKCQREGEKSEDDDQISTGYPSHSLTSTKGVVDNLQYERRFRVRNICERVSYHALQGVAFSVDSRSNPTKG